MNIYENLTEGEISESLEKQKNRQLIKAFEVENKALPPITRDYLIGGPSEYTEYFLKLPAEIREALDDLIEKRRDLVKYSLVLLKEGLKVYQEKGFQEKLVKFNTNLEKRIKQRKNPAEKLPEFLFQHVVSGSTPDINENIISEMDAPLIVVITENGIEKEQVIYPNKEVIEFVNQCWQDLPKDQKGD